MKLRHKKELLQLGVVYAFDLTARIFKLNAEQRIQALETLNHYLDPSFISDEGTIHALIGTIDRFKSRKLSTKFASDYAFLTCGQIHFWN